MLRVDITGKGIEVTPMTRESVQKAHFMGAITQETAWNMLMDITTQYRKEHGFPIEDQDLAKELSREVC